MTTYTKLITFAKFESSVNTLDKCGLPIKSAVTGGKKYFDDEGSLTGVAAVAMEIADVVTMDAMVAMVAVAKVPVGVAASAWWRQQ